MALMAFIFDIQLHHGHHLPCTNLKPTPDQPSAKPESDLSNSIAYRADIQVSIWSVKFMPISKTSIKGQNVGIVDVRCNNIN